MYTSNYINIINLNIAYSTSVGSSMSNTALYGGSLGDILDAGWKSSTSSDTLKSVVIAGATAGITVGVTTYLNNATDGFITVGNSAGNSIGNQSFIQRLTNSAYESTMSNIANTTMQSLVNGDSFSDSLKNQGLNIIAGTIGNIGAKEIGLNYHGGNLGDGALGKSTQLLLHAGLGAVTNTITGNDALSGAVSGVVGELTGDILRNNGVGKETGTKIAGLTGGLSALVTGKLTGLDSKDISNNVFAGQRTGENAAENNAFGDYGIGEMMNDIRDVSEAMDIAKGNGGSYDDSLGSGDDMGQNTTLDNVNTLLALGGVVDGMPTITMPEGLTFMDGEYSFKLDSDGLKFELELSTLKMMDSYGAGSAGFGNGSITINFGKDGFELGGGFFWFKGNLNMDMTNNTSLEFEGKAGGGEFNFSNKGVKANYGAVGSVKIIDTGSGKQIEVEIGSSGGVNTSVGLEGNL